MAVPTSKSAVVKAIVGNSVVTLGKGIAAAVSGSGVMVAETVHSLVDTLNQCLLLIGHQRSLRKATEQYPFGFGQEANFWGLLAAIGILVFGGGVSVLHGFQGLWDPHPPQSVALSLGILAFATLIEAWVLASVVLGLAETRDNKPWLKHLATQPTGTITVLLEDLAAVGGCLLAAISVSLCALTGNGIFDAIVQLIIGAMLSVVGIYLIWHNRGALIGRSVSLELVNELRIFLADFEGIDRVTELKTRQLSAYTFTLKAEVVFSGGELAQALMDEHVPNVRNAESNEEAAKALGVFANRLFIAQAEYVDHLEEKIRQAYPGAVYIYLEPHLREQEERP